MEVVKNLGKIYTLNFLYRCEAAINMYIYFDIIQTETPQGGGVKLMSWIKRILQYTKESFIRNCVVNLVNFSRLDWNQRFCRDKPCYISRNGRTKSCHATCQNNT